ncbi:Uncharacterised protein [Mycobacteroides abscessus subsp. massiliense]|nr:Uncharacterised protein [Mycobacteroides abscessus subsp. massiliense]
MGNPGNLSHAERLQGAAELPGVDIGEGQALGGPIRDCRQAQRAAFLRRRLQQSHRVTDVAPQSGFGPAQQEQRARIYAVGHERTIGESFGYRVDSGRHDAVVVGDQDAAQIRGKAHAPRLDVAMRQGLGAFEM